MTDPSLTIPAGTRSRCPICDHPSTVTMPKREDPAPFGETRNSVMFSCDRGHCWTTSWTTDDSEAS